MLYVRSATVPSRVVAPPAQPVVAAPPARRHAALRPPSFISPTFTSGYTPVTFAQSAPLPSSFALLRAQDTAAPGPAQPEEIEAPAVEPRVVPPLPMVSELVREVPLPAPRPAFLLPGNDAPPKPTGRRRMARQMPMPMPPAVAPDRRNFFEKLFGGTQSPGSALAYAAPDDGGLGIFGVARTVDRWTAVYDIAAHTVTLPDGRRLEAHSGIGASKDNPRSVAEHMRGATPPAVYDLTSREGLFHGVPALRLNPVGGIPYGRMGLLAHSYMLGPRGDSNGCVVFRDYRAFRQAYDSGMVRRLVVVAGRD